MFCLHGWYDLEGRKPMKVFEAPNSLIEIPRLDRVGTFIPVPADIPNVRNIKIHPHSVEVTNVGGVLKEEPLLGLFEYEIEGRMY